jgi:tetratricopeptide (TPR) repeat protein
MALHPVKKIPLNYPTMSNVADDSRSPTDGGFTPVSMNRRLESAEITWQELWPRLVEKQRVSWIGSEDFVGLIFPLLESALVARKVNRGFQVIDRVGDTPIPEASLVQWHKLNGKLAGLTGELSRVLDHARKLLELAENYPGDGTRVAAWAAAGVLASLLDDLEEAGMSELLHRQGVKVALQLFGPGHRNVLDSQNDLANALHGQGKHAEAEEVIREVLTACEHVFGPDHPGTLESRDNLALALHLQGKYGEAELEFRKILAIRLRVLGPTHFDTLASRNNLALELSAQGKHAEEEQEHRALLASRERMQGPENPQTLWARSLLIHNLRVQNKHAQAEAGLHELLKIRERVLGPDHPDTLKTLSDLAATFRVQGKQEEAAKVLRELLARREHALGPDHPEVYQSCFNLAFALLHTGKLDEAIGYAARNEQGCLRLYGADGVPTREARKLLETVDRELKRRGWFEDFKKRWPNLAEPSAEPADPA